ncbi:uncharacterized protein LOC124461239 [Drosophila willistoni]|uniref:uncharacterized protein LOC124461239 n=1 Tax=Drosophila willistoni TaxID=7260 RepID=UPI001F0869B7|nr:uncharacterized protein LOC124461239 [Drosophila willistoni]
MLYNEITELTVAGLKEKLKELNLSVKGNKPELIERLISYFDLDTNEESLYSEANTSNQGEVEEVEREVTMAFTLKDIRDSLTEFDGSNKKDVLEWLSDFEGTAVTVQWNDLQKFIYGRQLLTGAAKLFVNSQEGLTSWGRLKSALQDEFTVKLSAKEVHKQLESRKKKYNESLVEYFYLMKSIAKRGSLDEESIVEYIIEGIPDSKMNKSVLYQARDLKELREKLTMYEKYASNQ